MGYLTRALICRKWASNRRRDAVRLASQPLPTGVEVLEGLPYLSGSHPMHTLNLYRPLGADGSLPVIVDIHGGGWMYGDRELNQAYCMYLASQGWAVMGMSYRLLPEVDLREQIQDVFASFHWLERHLKHIRSGSGPALPHRGLRRGTSGRAGRLYPAGLLPPGVVRSRPPGPPLPGPGHRPRGMRCLPLQRSQAPFGQGSHPGIPADAVRPRWPLLPLWGHASFEDTAPGLSLPPILVIASEPDRYYRQSRRLIDWLDRSPWSTKLCTGPAPRGERLTHVFEVSHWDWPESRETNDRTLDFFRRACAAPEQAAEE